MTAPTTAVQRPSQRAAVRRRVSSRSALASFADVVSPSLRPILRTAEAMGLRGDTRAALDLLVSTASGLAAGAPDDDRVAIGELAVVVSAWGSELIDAHPFLEDLAARVRSSDARGALLFTRGRAGTAAETPDILMRALAEFRLAGDLRGQAVTLGELCWPREDGLSGDYRVTVGREGLALARQTGDPWAIAFCAGRLAGCETYLDRPSALEHWAQAAQVLPSSPDAVTAEIASLNQFNWAHTAYGHGDYALAGRVAREGKLLSHGATWQRKFAAVEALVHWRTGDHDAAAAGARAARAGRAQMATGMAGIVLGAVALEREGRPDPKVLEDSLGHIEFDEQMLWLAYAVRASMRVARHEPFPLREVRPALDQAARMGVRFGWEDLALVIALEDPDEARDVLETMAPLWPANPRGTAIRIAVEGLVRGTEGHELVLEAAERFEGLPEPVTAGRLLHAAAGLAPDATTGNRLRRRAIDIFQLHGADRSLAAVLRDRSLHRGHDLPAVPASQRLVSTAGLTAREREVAMLAAQGLTAQEIAEQLHISLGTARNHVLRVREKFGGVPKRKLAQLLADGA
ncbi:LuxR C-terminal-related transcriptional regulator [Oryzobacter telluris]|uniref:helix-turn-helix transcriptional regulator n=1 Tax=Oryzobacter telluris TaxID=3149179 RepID=UPI00370D57C2